MLLLSRLLFVLAAFMAVQPALADNQTGEHQAKPSPATGAGQKPAEAQKPGQMQMSAVTLTVIIKDAIIALNHANMTGNYSVLRDMGSPIFRESFDQARLAILFANLRARQIDMSPAYYLSPNLTKNPELSKDGELVLAGFFRPSLCKFNSNCGSCSWMGDGGSRALA